MKRKGELCWFVLEEMERLETVEMEDSASPLKPNVFTFSKSLNFLILEVKCFLDKFS